jgi:hypothetical protein
VTKSGPANAASSSRCEAPASCHPVIRPSTTRIGRSGPSTRSVHPPAARTRPPIVAADSRARVAVVPTEDASNSPTGPGSAGRRTALQPVVRRALLMRRLRGGARCDRNAGCDQRGNEFGAEGPRGACHLRATEVAGETPSVVAEGHTAVGCRSRGSVGRAGRGTPSIARHEVHNRLPAAPPSGHDELTTRTAPRRGSGRDAAKHNRCTRSGSWSRSVVWAATWWDHVWVVELRPAPNATGHLRDIRVGERIDLPGQCSRNFTRTNHQLSRGGQPSARDRP